MTDELKVSGEPAGYVLSVDPKTGVATRNDGRKLKPAENNPWYVLMTIAGEPEFLWDDKVAENRRYWNGWACSKMSAEERAALAARIKLPVEELAPLSGDEMAEVTAAFAERLPGVGVPDVGEVIDLSHTHFSEMVLLNKWVFSEAASFDSATFSGDAWFGSATFSGGARFGSATFSKDAWFNSTTFSRFASFDSATFSGPAVFIGATFGGMARFSGGRFDGVTRFAGAKFQGAVPEFYQRAFHQNTVFTDQRDNWPKITEKNAAESERAYTRLRQVMKGLDKPDDEAFFGRQEMRCKALTEGWLHWALSWTYGALSDYGYSVGKPAAGLLVQIGLGWGLFGSWLRNGLGFPGNEGIWQGLAMSVANSFPYLGFQRLYIAPEIFAEMPGWLKVMGAMQTVAGGVLLFLLLLGLRNRFRLK